MRGRIKTFTTYSAGSWCYTGPVDRSWWGGLWAERLTESPFGDRAVEHGLATRSDLGRLADAWLRWAASDDGWFLIPHGEILAQVPIRPIRPTRPHWSNGPNRPIAGTTHHV